MKTFILLISFGFFGLSINAQTSTPDVLASGGGFTAGPGFTNSFTVGQGSLPETFTTGTFMLTQGFQQPVDIGTGLAPVNDIGNIGVYPNPTSGQIFLEYTLTESAVVVIETFDVLGQIVFSTSTTGYAGKQLYPVDLSTHTNGIYFVRCTIKNLSETTSHTSKITLTR